MTAYYNEIDPYAAQWLRNLIDAGHIAPGVVDERDIRDVKPEELEQYTQCHFFAGIGIWSLALRRAGWPDDKPVWTGSCPCQPFSAAGKGDGFIDERHLWPHWFHLITQCEPSDIFGEQVASKDGLGWLDLVQADLEGAGYASGAVDLCAAGVGAPHIRQRLWFVAERMGDTRSAGLSNGEFETLGRKGRREERGTAKQSSSTSCGLADSDSTERSGRGVQRPGKSDQPLSGQETEQRYNRGCASGGLADADGRDSSAEREQCSGEQRQQQENGGVSRLADSECNGHDRAEGNAPEQSSNGQTDGLSVGGGESLRGAGRPGPTNGFWRDADWLYCRDEKWRAVSAKPQPLADGSAESLGQVCARTIKKIEEEINAWAMEREIKPAEGLRDLQNALGSEAARFWQAGGIPGLHEAPFLLAFMRQLQEEGRGFAECAPLPCAEAFKEEMRVLRAEYGASCAPHQYGLEGRQEREYTDALCVLSSILARHAHTTWGDAHQAYAETLSPLTKNAKSRVGRLKGYGNAINVEAAQAFIGSYLTDQHLRSPTA